MLYQQRQFTLPASNIDMSRELWAYRMGLIDEAEYERLTGHKPDQDDDQLKLARSC